MTTHSGRIKALAIFLLLLLLLGTQTACSSNNKIYAEANIPLMLFSDAGEEKTNGIAATWNVATMSLTIESPIMEASGKFYQRIAWLTPNSVLLHNNQGDTILKDNRFKVERLQSYEYNTIINQGLKLTATSTTLADIWSYEITLGDSETYQQKLSREYQIENQNYVVGHPGFIAGAKRTDQGCTIVFKIPVVNAEQQLEPYLCSVTIENNIATWSLPIRVPIEHINILASCSPNETVFIGEKLYMASANNLFYYDIEKNQIVELNNLVNDALKIIPNTTYRNIGEEPIDISLFGPSDEMVICRLPVESTDQSRHILYFLIYNDSFAGAIDFSGNSITLYNQALKKQIVSIDNLTLKGTPARFYNQSVYY